MASQLLLALLALIAAPSAHACLPPGATNSGVMQGKTTHVCVVASPLSWTPEGTSNFSRVAFLPTTDRFSRLSFQQCESVVVIACGFRVVVSCCVDT